MGQEHIQTRVPDDLLERIEDYQETEGYMNRAETIRALLRAGLKSETEPGDNEPTGGERDRLTALAQIGEKLSLAGALFTALSLTIPLLSLGTIATFNLTLGSFGSYLILGATLASFTLGVICVTAGGLLLAELLIRYGIQVGYFGHQLGKHLPVPAEVTA